MVQLKPWSLVAKFARTFEPDLQVAGSLDLLLSCSRWMAKHAHEPSANSTWVSLPKACTVQCRLLLKIFWPTQRYPQNQTGEILHLFTCCCFFLVVGFCLLFFCAWKCLSQTVRCLSLRLAPRKGQFVIPNWPMIKAFLVTCGYNGICMKHSRKNTVPNPDVTIERQAVEDVCPIKHGDFQMSY